MGCGSRVVSLRWTDGLRRDRVECFPGHEESQVAGHPGEPCRLPPGFLAPQVPGRVKGGGQVG